MNRETLFWTALKLSEPDRTRFIEEACPDESERDWLKRMLRNHEEGDRFMEGQRAIDADAATVASPAGPIEDVVGVDAGDRHAGSLPDVPGCEIEMVLGEGGMGTVFKGRQEGLERDAAIKLLKVRQTQGSPEAAERFRREAKAMARLAHPNIVSIYDSGETRDGAPYFVMEFVEGDDLHRHIRRGPMPEADALGIGVAVCEALAFAHSQGFVHRDIKPQNILIGSDGAVKVTDFGLVKLVENPGLTREGAVMGTPRYWAPEQSDPELTRGIDHRADIYAFGGTLYHMLTGVVPEKNYVAPSAACGCDKRLDALIERCLAPDPDLRYPTAAALLDDLVEIRDLRPLRARLLSHAAAVLLAGVAAALVASTSLGRRTDAMIQDLWFSARPEIAVSEDLVLVAVTDDCLRADRLGAWPWDRGVHAKLIDELASKGATAIAFDMFLPERPSADGDHELAAAAARHGAVVFPDFLDSKTGHVEDYAGVAGAKVHVAGNVEHAAAVIRAAGSRPAQCHAERDDIDGKLRRVPLFLLDPSDPARPRPNLGLALALEMLDSEFSWSSAGVEVDLPSGGALRIPVDDLKTMPVNYPKSLGSFPAMSYSALLSGNAGIDLRGKGVMVGFTATGLTHVTADKHVTVVDSLTPGVLVNAAITNSVLTGEFLREVPRWGSFVAGLCLAVIVALACFSRGGRCGLIFAAISLAALAGAGYWLFAQWGVVFPVVSGLLVVGAATAALTVASRLGRRSPDNLSPRIQTDD